MEAKISEYTMDDIKAANKKAGQYFFEPDTMRFFGSKTYAEVYEGPGGVFFLTSENDGQRGRLFTVRQFFPDTGEVETAGDFYSIGTRVRARTLAMKYAEKGAPQKNAN